MSEADLKNSPLSWGRYPKTKVKSVSPLFWRDDAAGLVSGLQSPILAQGLRRSYGDSCLNDGGSIIDARGLNRFISFDFDAGILWCEAGVSLSEILSLIVPQGWFLPVLPGTQYVTIGGAIANDIHGKNHHQSGTFGRYVNKIELLRSSGERLICSEESNVELYRATIGGLGLTGLMLSAEIRLLPISSAEIIAEEITFYGLDEFFELSAESDSEYSYTVAWIDSVATGDDFARGIFIRGNHNEEMQLESESKRLGPLLSVPVDMPNFLLNSYSIQAFNWLYFKKQRSDLLYKSAHYLPFFFPLDVLGGWNKMYGSRGFVQYQFVVPMDVGKPVVSDLLQKSLAADHGSFLSVLKQFGALPSPGMLSFPKEGVTLTLDFAFQGERTLSLLDSFDAIVAEAGGRVYPAKDARMSAESFRCFYPNWEEFSAQVDPKFSSSFWRRVTDES